MPRSAADPLLLTPGPVSVSMSTKQVMLRDRASGGDEFHADIKLARDYMVALVGGQDAYTAIPLPGSATYANEAVIAGLVPAGGKVLIHTNGVYGDRLIEIANTPASHAPPSAPALPAAHRGAVRGGDRGGPRHHACVRRALRNQHRRGQPDRSDRRGVPPPRPGPVHRRGCQLRRHAARCPQAGLPGRYRLVEQMHARRARASAGRSCRRPRWRTRAAIADRWCWTSGTRTSTWIAPMPSASRRRHR